MTGPGQDFAVLSKGSSFAKQMLRMLIVEFCNGSLFMIRTTVLLSSHTIAITIKHPSYAEMGKMCLSADLQITFLAMLENKLYTFC